MSYQTIRMALGAALLAAACSTEAPVAPGEPAAGHSPNLYLTNAGAQVRIGDATRNEVDGGLTIGFQVRLSGFAATPVYLQYSVRPADGSAATEGSGSCTPGADYVDAGPGIVVLTQTDTLKTIAFTICGDTRDEPDEQILVTLVDYSASGVQIVDGQAIGTILDNDDPPAFSIRDIRYFEGDSGIVRRTVTVDATGTSQQAIQLSWRTVPNSGWYVPAGTATASGGCRSAGDDYVAVAGDVVTIPAGQLGARIEVAWCGDFRLEPDEDFTVQLTSATAGATIADGLGVVTLLDDEAARARLSIADAGTVIEPEAYDYDHPAIARFVVSTANMPANGQPVTVQYETVVSGTAVGGTHCGGLTNARPVDFVRQAGSVTISPTAPTATIEILVCGDAEAGGATETFSVRIFGPSANAYIARAVGIATITPQP